MYFQGAHQTQPALCLYTFSIHYIEGVLIMECSEGTTYLPFHLSP